MAQARYSRTRLLRPQRILPAHSRPWHTGVAPVCEDEARRPSVPSRRAGYAERPARRLSASPGKDPRHYGSTTLGVGPESSASRTAGVQDAAPGVQRPSGPDTGGQRRWAGGRGCVQTQTPRLLRERGTAWLACVRDKFGPTPQGGGVSPR